MEESADTERLRLRKEEAVRQIIAKERTGQQVAETFSVSRQAVSLWVQRYKKNGDLVPGKRGRKKLRPFTALEKQRFFEHVVGLYEKKGYGLGDDVPGSKVIMEGALRGALQQISEMPASATRTMGLMKELALPPYNSAIIVDGVYGDGEDWEDDSFPLRDPFAEAPAGADPLLGSGPLPPRDDPDEEIPSTPEEYAAWHEETRAILKKRGINYDPEEMRMEKPSAEPGVRVGKHAKGTRHTPPKRRKKRRKRP